MPNQPNKRNPSWDSSKTRRLANEMAADAEQHQADAMRREADGWAEGADSAKRWARMKQRAATLLHESADAAAGREQARKDAERYELRDPDPNNLMPTGAAGCLPEVYECASCGTQARVTEQQAATEAGGTDLNAGYRVVFARGWRPVRPRGVLCPSCVASCVDACTQADDPEDPDQADLFAA